MPVIISGPNSGADKQIEIKIVELFCLRYDCREYFEKTYSNQSKVPSSNNNKLETGYQLTSDDITGEWLLDSEHHVSFSLSNGLTFNFTNVKNRKHKENWAIAISHELALLINNLKLSQEKGIVIRWSSLMIDKLPLTDNAYKVTINTKNDYIKLTLPSLGENSQLFRQLIPWLKSYFKKQSDYRKIIDNADKYINNL
ncbi:MAG: hypothetical protein KZQ64_09795 [gamma proteobacterium symbiont of Bathyaustriella thionipta]|nr:hypothetical protein [gamma proteobacterium symbiont of Bathyaustriella thionipta]MCU7950715.1 hypothetical protein [gamma proteobacterium symbiont of Bathyaustriella thionipta]MCU7953664.1 hypothetical protein [gamma proteobacterium symbiont of Bathyaustriella thionipta]MCU7957210.1 hypothetical protein [gamma proteobacterium symbiont of Bathyaustriella thionipta]MCU7967169.1 hypothetical protein [gamma proteobacterium symbiont of Bathyaustriella thionipta]